MSSTRSLLHRLRSSNLAFGLACALIVVVLAALFFAIATNYIGNDEANYMYEAGRVLDGAMPFRDFPTRAPFQVLLLVILVKLFGPTVAVLKCYELGLFLAAGLLVFLLLRRFSGRWISLAGATLIVAAPTFFLTKIVLNTTNLDIVLALLALVLLRSPRAWLHILAGAVLACAVFTRETTAFFICALVVYMLVRREWGTLVRVLCGGLVVAVPVVAYFSYEIGFWNTAVRLLGVGYTLVEEKQASWSYSRAELVFSAASMAPFIFMATLSVISGGRKQWSHLRHTDLECIWAGTMIVFYAVYLFKRGFLQSYGSEVLPMLAIACWALIDWKVLHERRVALLSGIVIMTVVPVCLYASIRPQGGRHGIDLIAGSGISGAEFRAVTAAIRERSKPVDIILSGNMAVVLETGLIQFDNASRMMIYERGSSLNENYGVHSRDELIAGVISRPPAFIVADHHLDISVRAEIQPLIDTRYEMIYSGHTVEAFALKRSR